MFDVIERYREQLLQALRTVPEARIVEVVHALREVHRRRGSVFVLASPDDERGGGHLSEELARGVAAGAFAFRLVPLPSATRQVMGWKSEWAYEDAGAEGTRGLVRRGDAVIAMSRRGQELGLVRALRAARRAGAAAIALVGSDGGAVGEAADICLHVRCQSLDQVEDVQTMLVHMLCAALRALLGGAPEGRVPSAEPAPAAR
ncbi:MAG: SIS domain-containing protein [Anaerolineae bacterium]|nr:SIS domain-containing protein [Anaerolineae bacterium]